MKNFIEINFFSKKFLYIIFLGLFELIRSLFTKYTKYFIYKIYNIN